MSKISVSGRLRLRIHHIDGSVEHYDQRNMLMAYTVQRLIDAITTSEPDTDFIVKVGYGEGTTAPTPEDTDLTNAFVKNLSNLDTTTPGVITATFTLESGEGNGLAISEFGLLTTADNLVARRTREPIAKVEGVRIEGTWTITFTTN